MLIINLGYPNHNSLNYYFTLNLKKISIFLVRYYFQLINYLLIFIIIKMSKYFMVIKMFFLQLKFLFLFKINSLTFIIMIIFCYFNFIIMNYLQNLFLRLNLLMWLFSFNFLVKY